MDRRWQARNSAIHNAVVWCSFVISSRTPQRISTTFKYIESNFMRYFKYIKFTYSILELRTNLQDLRIPEIPPTWNSKPCLSLQYSFILGYTYSINVFRSINISVNVELVKMRTIFDGTGGRSFKQPPNFDQRFPHHSLCKLLKNTTIHY